jgi:hypothetical protein
MIYVVFVDNERGRDDGMLDCARFTRRLCLLIRLTGQGQT